MEREWLAERVELLASSTTAPESGGRQPRIRHDVNDHLLHAPQRERTSNPYLGADHFAAAATVSTLFAATSKNLAVVATAGHRDPARPWLQRNEVPGHGGKCGLWLSELNSPTVKCRPRSPSGTSHCKAALFEP